MIDTKVLLKMWANSVASVSLPGATKPAIYNTSLDSRQYLLDEEVDEIEKAMVELFNDDLRRYELIKSVYIKEKSCSNIAKLLHCRTDKITTMLSESEYFIRGKVITYFKKR